METSEKSDPRKGTVMSLAEVSASLLATPLWLAVFSPPGWPVGAIAKRILFCNQWIGTGVGHVGSKVQVQDDDTLVHAALVQLDFTPHDRKQLLIETFADSGQGWLVWEGHPRGYVVQKVNWDREDRRHCERLVKPGAVDDGGSSGPFPRRIP